MTFEFLICFYNYQKKKKNLISYKHIQSIDQNSCVLFVFYLISKSIRFLIEDVRYVHGKRFTYLSVLILSLMFNTDCDLFFFYLFIVLYARTFCRRSIMMISSL